MTSDNNNQNTEPNPNPVPPGYYAPQPTTPNYPPVYNHPGVAPMYAAHQQYPQVPGQQVYYPQQPPTYYYVPPPTYSGVTVVQTNPIGMPLIDSGRSLKDRLSDREYEVNLGKWFEEAWTLFKENWLALVLFTIVFIGVQFIPYVGSIFVFCLASGYFIAGSHAVRSGGYFRWTELFHGIMLFFPLLVQAIVYMLLVSFGLLLLIIPGLYFMVAFSFCSLIYIEYREEGLGIMEAMTVSRKLVHKHFWGIIGLFIFQLLLLLAGAVFFLVGVGCNSSR